MRLTELASAHAAAPSSFTAAMEHVAQGFEALGALILVAGVIWSVVLAVLAWRRSGSAPGYATLRHAFGGSLLLSLEVLVAADLVRTVAVATTVGNVLILGLIVLIRTFLSFSLEIEIYGTLPWRRGLASGATAIARATQAARRPDPQ